LKRTHKYKRRREWQFVVACRKMYNENITKRTINDILIKFLMGKLKRGYASK
jgi:hypothetical protein